MSATQSELTVITQAKALCSYIMTVTDKSPKRFRFTLVAKLQNYALNVIENLYYAIEVPMQTAGFLKRAYNIKGQGCKRMAGLVVAAVAQR